MSAEFERKLEVYAELILRVGLNVQPGQRLAIADVLNHGVSLEAAPLVRKIAARAYQSGVRLVDVLWGDDQVRLARFRYAPRDSFEEYPLWQAEALLRYAQQGDALLSLIARDPDLLRGQDPELIGTAQQTTVTQTQAYRELVSRNAINWLVAGAASSGWAAKVFPDLPRDQATARLWEALFTICRLDAPDPVAAWHAHLDELAARSAYLTGKQYHALRMRAPGTDFVVGLPRGHLWKGGRMTSERGVVFTPNLPTEEIFTLPHRERADGVVTATKPLSYAGVLIEDFSLTFEAGRVAKITARRGEDILRKLVETDEGAGRLGEVALVPHSSPISQSGLLFFNTLYDENAAIHVALGRSYAFTLEEGDAMSLEAFAAAGGNLSAQHVDFMIGSDQMDVDGILEDGSAEPVMRGGEWAW